MTNIVLNFSIDKRSQEGVVLIVGLVMVLLLSIIALAAMKGSGLQEAMMGNTRDRNIAFQAAEAGLTAGEAVVDEDSVPTAPACPIVGICVEDLDNPPGQSVLYFTDDDWKNKAVLTTSMALPTQSQPHYIVEALAPYRPDDGSGLDGIAGLGEITPYRITSRGVGLTKESTIILQSYYHRFDR